MFCTPLVRRSREKSLAHIRTETKKTPGERMFGYMKNGTNMTERYEGIAIPLEVYAEVINR